MYSNENSPNSSKIAKLSFTFLARDCKVFLPKWWNFAKSGHTIAEYQTVYSQLVAKPSLSYSVWPDLDGLWRWQARNDYFAA